MEPPDVESQVHATSRTELVTSEHRRDHQLRINAQLRAGYVVLVVLASGNRMRFLDHRIGTRRARRPRPLSFDVNVLAARNLTRATTALFSSVLRGTKCLDSTARCTTMPVARTEITQSQVDRPLHPSDVDSGSAAWRTRRCSYNETY